MSRAFTLMTAMPPTKGHFNLMNFTSWLSTDGKRSKVIVCTQPGEPFAKERYYAIRHAAIRVNGVDVEWLHEELPQDPNTPGFWAMWKRILRSYGFAPGDTFVSSEVYGARVAEELEGHFIPFDPGRELIPAKGTEVRAKMLANFDKILPEFQHNLRTTVTLFGAESTGKTTLSKDLAGMVNGHWLFEWARPYLETVGPDITIESMNDIWRGQWATQHTATQMFDRPFVIQDTDLFSTVGYWEQPHWADVLGPVPEGLIKQAHEVKSDLYLITLGNIPFEKDPLRYGGDHRESPDDFWIGIAEKYGLNYRVLTERDMVARRGWAIKHSMDTAAVKAAAIAYDRKGL